MLYEVITAGLNAPQREAIRYLNGPCLVLAGAGSGKTRVITHKIAYLVDDCGYSPTNIAAITFTNKAAKEMKERVREMAGNRSCKGMVIATFHSLCVRLLKSHIDRLGFKKNFSIYPASDQQRLIRDRNNFV